MKLKIWNKTMLTLMSLLCLILFATAAPAAVLSEEEEADLSTSDESGELIWVDEEQGEIEIDEDAHFEFISGDGEAHENVMIMKVEDGEGEAPHVIHWSGKPAERGFLGVALTELSPELRIHFGVPENTGVMVSSVVDGSPAQAAGIEVGDVITAIDGELMESSFDVQKAVWAKKDGEAASIEMWRKSSPMTVNATVALKKMKEFDVGILGDPDMMHKNMIIMKGPGDENVFEFKIPHGDVDMDFDDEKLNEILMKVGESGHDFLYFDSDQFKDQMKNLEEYFESPEWQEKMNQIKDREIELEQRLEELEEKLEKLEKNQE